MENYHQASQNPNREGCQAHVQWDQIQAFGRMGRLPIHQKEWKHNFRTNYTAEKLLDCWIQTEKSKPWIRIVIHLDKRPHWLQGGKAINHNFQKRSDSNSSQKACESATELVLSWKTIEQRWHVLEYHDYREAICILVPRREHERWVDCSRWHSCHLFGQEAHWESNWSKVLSGDICQEQERWEKGKVLHDPSVHEHRVHP